MIIVNSYKNTDFWFPLTPFSYYQTKRSRNYGTLTDTSASVAGFHSLSSIAFAGSVAIPDGRIVLVPRDSTAIKIYNPSTNSVETSSLTMAGNQAYSGSVLLPDGRVFFAPYKATTALIYNPVTDTSVTPAGTYDGDESYISCILLRDGRVFLVPHKNNKNAKVYDPVANSVSNVPDFGTNGGDSSLPVLLSDGRVFCAPYNTNENRGAVYDPVANTVTKTMALKSGAYGGFLGSVLLPNGKVFCVPVTKNEYAKIYDPATDTAFTTSMSPSSSDDYTHLTAVLMPDGDSIFLIPFFNVTAKIYKVSTNTVSNANLTPTGTNCLFGGNLLPDGRIFCTACQEQNSYIYGNSLSTLPKSRRLSTYDNKT
jgi:hypothetical protein